MKFNLTVIRVNYEFICDAKILYVAPVCMHYVFFLYILIQNQLITDYVHCIQRLPTIIVLPSLKLQGFVQQGDASES